MHGILLLRLSAVTAYFLVNARELAASELSLQQSPLDKTIEEIGEKIEKAENICEKLMILMEKTKIWKTSSKNMHGKKRAPLSNQTGEMYFR